MKRAIIFCLLLTAFSMNAQKDTHSRKGEFMKELEPEQLASLQTKRLALALDLTEAQQKQILAINLERAKLRQQKKEAALKRKDEGKTAMSTDERYKQLEERLDFQIARKQKMKEILTEAQYNKWEDSQVHNTHYRKHSWRGKRS